MSLIQDALRRQAEEAAGMRLPGMPYKEPQPQQPPPQKPPEPPPQKPPEPPPPQKPPEIKKIKTFPIMPFILFLILFLTALLGLSLYLINPHEKAVKKVTQVSTSADASAFSTTSEPVKVLEAPVQAIETIIEPLEPPVAEPPVAAESVMKIKKAWPELKLTGIAQGDRQRLAILNDKMLSAGRKIGDVTIIQVRDNNIIVEYRGERRTLYIGE